MDDGDCKKVTYSLFTEARLGEHTRLNGFVNKQHVSYEVSVNVLFIGMSGIPTSYWFQTTHPTSGGAATAVTNYCANCVELPAHSNGGPIYHFFGQAGHADPLMAGAAPLKSR